MIIGSQVILKHDLKLSLDGTGISVGSGTGPHSNIKVHKVPNNLAISFPVPKGSKGVIVSDNLKYFVIEISWKTTGIMGDSQTAQFSIAKDGFRFFCESKGDLKI